MWHQIACISFVVDTLDSFRFFCCNYCCWVRKTCSLLWKSVSLSLVYEEASVVKRREAPWGNSPWLPHLASTHLASCLMGFLASGGNALGASGAIFTTMEEANDLSSELMTSLNLSFLLCVELKLIEVSWRPKMLCV